MRRQARASLWDRTARDRSRKQRPSTGLRLDGCLDVVLGRKTVAEHSFAIASPDDAIDRDRLRPDQRHTPLPRGIGDPALAVAGASVIEMSDLVDRGIGIFGRGRCSPAGSCQGDIPRRRGAAGRASSKLPPRRGTARSGCWWPESSAAPSGLSWVRIVQRCAGSSTSAARGGRGRAARAAPSHRAASRSSRARLEWGGLMQPRLASGAAIAPRHGSLRPGSFAFRNNLFERSDRTCGRGIGRIGASGPRTWCRWR